MKAYDLEIGDKCKCYFTKSICEVINKDFSYGRTFIRVSFFNSIIDEDDSVLISGQEDIIKVEDIK